MAWLRLAWKNTRHNPLTLFLNLILLTLGIGLINFILLLNTQLKNKFENNLAGIDMVVGAKGSPLQMILSSMYHIDAPTGNISIKEATPFLRDGHPLIKASVPLSMGDSYKGYRIIGTDHAILPFYKAEIADGKLWQNLYEVTIGSEIANSLDLGLGSKFKSSHGFNDDEDLEHDHGTLTVVGILKPTGSVIDQLILVNTESVWSVHDHQYTGEDDDDDHDHDDHGDHNHDSHDEHDHDSHDKHDHDSHKGHDHGHDHAHHDGHNHDAEHDHRNDMSRSHLLTHGDKDITSVLVQFKNKTNFQALNLPRNINENTDLQAATPAFEINRLYDMMGVGTKTLQLIAYMIAIVSAISIFVSLLNSLKQRKYELSILRVLGTGSNSLLALILLEGIILALLGFILGMLGSHIAMTFLGQNLTDKYNYPFTAWIAHGEELKLLFGTLGLGIVAALVPALLAYNTDIHNNLSDT